MKTDYTNILKKNLTNVLVDVLKKIEKNGLDLNQHLYITFQTKNKNIILPDWLKIKYPKEMTIVLQHEYWDLKVLKKNFEITLSFNNIKVNLCIPFDSIISFADPSANFGLKIKNEKINQKINQKINKNKNNIIDFNKFKKLN